MGYGGLHCLRQSHRTGFHAPATVTWPVLWPAGYMNNDLVGLLASLIPVPQVRGRGAPAAAVTWKYPLLRAMRGHCLLPHGDRYLTSSGALCALPAEGSCCSRMRPCSAVPLPYGRLHAPHAGRRGGCVCRCGEQGAARSSAVGAAEVGWCRQLRAVRCPWATGVSLLCMPGSPALTP